MKNMQINGVNLKKIVAVIGSIYHFRKKLFWIRMTVLNLKEINNERSYIYILSLISLTSCVDFRTLEKWDDARVQKKYEKARKAYYDKETPEQKRLRKKNSDICFKLYPSDIEKNKQCMKERGTPDFEY